MRSLRSLKCLKTLTFTTQKTNTYSPWTDCTVFDWKYHFWGEFAPKTEKGQIKLKYFT